jgi:DNA uptake protein ComE-like DNA-binding protein
MSLITLATLVTILGGLAAARRIESKALENRLLHARAERVAWSAANRALSIVQVRLDQPGGAFVLTDEWATFGTQGEESFRFGDETVRIEIVDACAFANLNTAPQAQLERLPLTTEQIDALLDWREAGAAARPEGGKDEYYNSLEQPYNAKLGALDTLEELLLVKGFTGRTLYDLPTEQLRNTTTLTMPDGEEAVFAQLVTVYSSSSNQAPDGQQKLNVNNASAQAMIGRGIPAQLAQQIVQRRNQQGTFGSINDLLGMPGINNQNVRAVLDNLAATAGATVTGRINVNTANAAVLMTLPGMTEDIASGIVQRAATGFQGLGDLMDVTGISIANLRPIVDQLTTTTRAWSVRVLATAGARSIAMEFDVRVGASGLLIANSRAIPRLLAMRVWNWIDAETEESNLGAGN